MDRNVQFVQALLISALENLAKDDKRPINVLPIQLPNLDKLADFADNLHKSLITLFLLLTTTLALTCLQKILKLSRLIRSPHQ